MRQTILIRDKGILGPDPLHLWQKLLGSRKMKRACSAARRIFIVAGGHGTEVDALVSIHGESIIKKIVFNDKFIFFTNSIKRKYPDITVLQGDFLQLELRDMKKFDVIIGNPPFNGDVGEERERAKNTNNSNLYFAFIKQAMDMADTVAFIVPAGWMQDKLKAKMVAFGLSSAELIPAECFPSVGIRSEITCVTLHKGYAGKIQVRAGKDEWEYERNGVLTFADPRCHSICDKISLTSNWAKVSKGTFIVPKGTKGSVERLIALDNTYTKSADTEHSTKVLIYCGGASVPPTYAYSSKTIDERRYGVAVPGVSDKYILGTPRIVMPGEGVSDKNRVRYYATLRQAELMVKFLTSSVIRFAMRVKKFNDTVNTNLNSWNWIPDVVFTHDWATDADLCGMLSLSADEAALIADLGAYK